MQKTGISMMVSEAGKGMLTDTKLRNLKPAEKPYKLTDRDGLYVTVLSTGTVSFRYNYRINNRQETLVIGRYGPAGLTLAEARERLTEAKKALASGRSPSRQKAREKLKTNEADSFGGWAELWLKNHPMAESTRDMRRSVYERDLKAPFGRLKMAEVSHEDLRSLCDKIVARGAPATAIHAREIVQLVFRYALERGHRYDNPAELVRPTSIARFQPKDRALSAEEIGLLYGYLERVSTAPTFRLAVKLLLLTMLRKSELTDAVWTEVNFMDAIWIIPGERMKRRATHRKAPRRRVKVDPFTRWLPVTAQIEFVANGKWNPLAILRRHVVLDQRRLQASTTGLGKLPQCSDLNPHRRRRPRLPLEELRHPPTQLPVGSTIGRIDRRDQMCFKSAATTSLVPSRPSTDSAIARFSEVLSSNLPEKIHATHLSEGIASLPGKRGVLSHHRL
jgi:integrase